MKENLNKSFLLKKPREFVTILALQKTPEGLLQVETQIL
jgi:hypothetical protein